MVDSVERSIHVFELVGNMGFNDIEKTLAYIQSERQKNPAILFSSSHASWKCRASPIPSITSLPSYLPNS